MFYGKLPILILAELVSAGEDATNARIASYILEHMDEVKRCSIRDLAAQTFVSTSSISRFCRDIGLADYAELRELVASTALRFEVCSGAEAPEVRKEEYIDAVQDSLQRVRRSLDMGQLQKLARDIRSAQRVAVFGVLKAETAAMNLQTDLAMLGRSSVTKIRVAQQMEYLEKADERDLIIIFSFTGIYFEYGLPRRAEARQGKTPKIWFITSDKKAKPCALYDEVIYFESRQDQASHPYQLQLVSSLIAQTYAHLLQEE